jgi:hypothetical protein
MQRSLHQTICLVVAAAVVLASASVAVAGRSNAESPHIKSLYATAQHKSNELMAVGASSTRPPIDAGSSVPNPVYLRAAPVATVSGGFDWTDALVGAAVGAAFILTIAGGTLAVRHARRERLAATPVS